ncbi:MAG: putative glycoside hydrolase [Planctomycetota bacterium]
MNQRIAKLFSTRGIKITAKKIALPFVLVVFLLGSVAHAQSFKETYPRVANISNKYALDYNDPDYRQRLARYDILVLGMWNGYARVDLETGETLGVADVVRDIKRRARLIGNDDILVGKYTSINETLSNPNDSAKRDRYEKITSEVGPGYPRNNDWFARDRNGNNLSSWPGTWLTNLTNFVQRDANGDTYPEWAARRDYDLFFKDIPELDIWFYYNWFYRPRRDADWNGDGSNDDRDDPVVRKWLRDGYRRALNRARRLAPDRIFMGNVDGNAVENVGMLTEPEFRGQLTALYEAALGLDYSAETWGGWDVMMDQYRTTIRNAQHNVALLDVHANPRDYKTMRYGLASALMDDGYFMFTSTTRDYEAQHWFDEFEVDLGRAVEPPQTQSSQNGVYIRRFEFGMALVNPKGNGTRTVQIEPGFKRFNGSQDPATNNGQEVESVRLSERDGLILVRTDADAGVGLPPPPPPQPQQPKKPKPPVMSDF